MLAPSTSLARRAAPSFRVEAVVLKAQFPVALAFAPDGRLFYTEKETGRVRVVSAEGQLQREPVITFRVDSYIERGLLGITLDPAYSQNGHIWVFYTQPNTVEPPYPINKVVRFTEENGQGRDPQVFLSLPVTTRVGHHNGGNLRFGPDGALYIATGDIGEAAFAQDLTAMQGRIHRFRVQGEALIPAPDNPFGADNSTYAYGFRNPFDFDFDPLSGDIIAGENGPQCDDEINLVFAGGNYGWRPDYPCDDKAPQEAARYVYPLTYFTPPQALTGVLVYDGAMFPDWVGDVFFCGWNQGFLWRMELDETRTQMAALEQVALPNQTCSTDIEVAPDGSLYFTNYNSIYRLSAE
jgi:glucose/arabinose dehydrogenase